MEKTEGYFVSIDGQTILLSLNDASVSMTMRMGYKTADELIEELSLMVDLAKKRAEES